MGRSETIRLGRPNPRGYNYSFEYAVCFSDQRWETLTVNAYGYADSWDAVTEADDTAQAWRDTDKEGEIRGICLIGSYVLEELDLDEDGEDNYYAQLAIDEYGPYAKDHTFEQLVTMGREL